MSDQRPPYDGYGQAGLPQPRPGQTWGQQPGYGPPQPYGYGAPDPYAPFGRHPVSGEPLSDKSKVVAGLLQLFFGGFGVGRFYMGSTGVAIAQLLLTVFGFLLAIVLIGFVLLAGVGIWALVDAIMILAGSPRDGQGRLLRS
ncbi:NINE protein [Solicola sp. PLA-1-18]|uniref:NINE protein n=1 Tax=Solicola sp. PLA-1-18 TaxID=3380532 RepID=UPI003B7AEB76